jgi:hypothetical protein
MRWRSPKPQKFSRSESELPMTSSPEGAGEQTAGAFVALERTDAGLAQRWCPFGHEVQAAPQNVYVFAGAGAWALAKARRFRFGLGSALLLPENEEPSNYRWPSVDSGVLVLGHRITRQASIELARCIVSAGTSLAYVVRDGEGFAVKSGNWRNPLNSEAS